MKKLLLSTIFILSIMQGFSQSFMHGVGVTTFIQSASGYSTRVVGGITYSPKISFAETDNTSISVGVPLSVGLSASVNTSSYYGSSGSASVMLNVPVVVNFNYGCGSSKENTDRFGLFAGAGFGYHYGISDYSDDYSDYEEKISGFGPMGNVGFRLGVGRRSHNIEIKFSYMKLMDVTKANIFGIAGLFNF